MDTLGVIGVLAIIVIGGAVAYLLKNSSNTGLSGDKKRIYQYNKTNIENFIRRKNWEALENMLDSRPLQDFPDLDKMVKDALKNKPKS